MSKLPSLIIYVSILACLISCQKQEKEQLKIGVSLCNDDQWHQAVISELKHEVLFYPEIDLEIKTIKIGDDQQQIEIIDSFIKNKKDLIVVSAGNAVAITPIVKKAYNAGIPVIILDQKIQTDDYTAHVGGDNYMIGHDIGVFIADKLKGRGNVVEIRGRMESTTDIERHTGFMEVISKYPEIHIVAEKRADFNTDTADEKMTEVIKENKHVDIVFAMDDLTAKGVYKAYQRAGIKQPFTIGVDALAGEGGGIYNILKGYQNISFIYPTGGDKTLEIAYNILKGKHYERNNTLYTGIVDSSNADIIQQQREHFFTEREKTDKVNNTLNQTLVEYSQQRVFFYISVLVVLLISVLLIISIIAYRSKSKSKAKLTEQYKEIERQSKELLEQKMRLEDLSHKLEEATNAKLVFFTNISHEFKTPLSLITGPLKTLLHSDELSAESKHLIGLAKRNSDILLHLISQIIDFNKYENHHDDIRFTHNNLKTFLLDLNELFNNLAKEKRVDFQFQYQDSEFSMWFDKEKIERVYLNILSNAFRYAPDNGTIRITLNKETVEGKEYAALSIFNNGSLIPEEQINSIFNRFYKVDAHDAGTGIGLALASSLVHLHNGRIHAYNKGNEGVVFNVLLPIIQEADIEKVENPIEAKVISNIPESSTELIADATPSNGDKPLILIIEDNDDIRNYIKVILQNDYTILEAENGRIGLDKATKHLPDAIISDVMMPEMDGLEVCRTIKENIPTCHIPVVLLTARSLSEHEMEGLENGADIYITKPFDGELLQVRVRKLIENRKRIIDAFSQTFVNDSKSETLGNVEQEYINRIQNYVMEHITDSSLDMETIAKHFGESYTQMYRKIKTITGYTPVELIKIIRLKYAKQLLNLKTKNIASVAYETGFSTPSYFTRCFKDFYKESPTDYLKKIQ